MEPHPVLTVSRPDEPPDVDARYAEPPPDRRRTHVIAGCVVVGAALGLLWTLLTVPHPQCEAHVSMCQLQLIHAAQLSKLALAALAGFAIGCGTTRNLRRHPEAHPRRAVDLPPPMDAGAALATMRARPRPHR